jgi:hypothetical protein
MGPAGTPATGVDVDDEGDMGKAGSRVCENAIGACDRASIGRATLASGRLQLFSIGPVGLREFAIAP